NIQTQLNNMFGAGNTRVFLRSTNNPATYDVHFGGGLALTHIDRGRHTATTLGAGNSVTMSVIDDGLGNEMQVLSVGGGGQFGLSCGAVSAPVGAAFANGMVASNATATTLQNYINTITGSFAGVPSRVTS